MEIPAILKKVPGVLAIGPKVAVWRAADGSGAPLEIAFADVKGMQASPPTAAKKRIKVTGNDDAAFVFEFADLPALEQARNELQAAIKAAKASSAEPEPKSAEPEQKSKATKRSVNGDKLLEPDKLLQNLELQRQILKQDKELAKTFQQTVMSGSLTNEQFWSMRINLLLTMAQQSMQSRGAYNVLSTIKPVTSSDNKVNISLTREKISDMFDQYPIVRKAYNDTVPSKLNEGSFWQRFFMSRLFLTLRGETVSQNHPQDAILDRYIAVLEESRKRRKTVSIQPEDVPGALNVEANSENNPETYGNRPDITMRFDTPPPGSISTGGGTAGLIRSMNGLSKRLLAGRRRAAQAKLPHQHTADILNEQRLSDLEGPPKTANSVAITVDLVDKTVAADKNANVAVSDSDRAQLSNDLAVLRLGEVGEDFEAIAAAQSRLDTLIDGVLDESAEQAHIALEVDSVSLVHATTLEFLRQFWRAHANLEPLEPLKADIAKSLERIRAVAAEGVSVDALEPMVNACNVALEA